MFDKPFSGVFPAMLCPFDAEGRVDGPALGAYAAELAGVEGVMGLVANGHTGEVTGLLPDERAEVTAIVAEAVGGRVKVVSGLCAEGSAEAGAHARAAADAGADAILLMPPHHWLRFGRKSQTAVGFFHDIAEAADVDIIVHQYPAWTKAGYTLAEMLEIVKVPRVVSIKMGTRDMARWAGDYRALKQAAPAVSILSCEDEGLLPTLLAGADGALVGLAGFVPRRVVDLVRAALSGDLPGARAAQGAIDPVVQIIYRRGEPSGDAHQRMKCARWLVGAFPSPDVRPPLRPLPADEVARIRCELNAAGYPTVH